MGSVELWKDAEGIASFNGFDGQVSLLAFGASGCADQFPISEQIHDPLKKRLNELTGSELVEEKSYKGA